MRISDWSSDVCSSDLNFGVDWAVRDDAFFYVTTRRGYRAGALNTPRLAPVLAPFQSFGPQKVTDYEAGAKLQWRTGGWYGRLNIAAFTAKFTDIQLRSEEHTSELKSLMRTSYAVFCL